MAIVPASQLHLCRVRRDMVAALDSQNWPLIADLDVQLSKAVDHAIKDPERNFRVLLSEVKQVLRLYGQLAETCHQQANLIASIPEVQGLS